MLSLSTSNCDDLKILTSKLNQRKRSNDIVKLYSLRIEILMLIRI